MACEVDIEIRYGIKVELVRKRHNRDDEKQREQRRVKIKVSSLSCGSGVAFCYPSYEVCYRIGYWKGAQLINSMCGALDFAPARSGKTKAVRSRVCG